MFDTSDEGECPDEVHAGHRLLIELLKQKGGEGEDGAVGVTNVMPEFRNRVAQFHKPALLLLGLLQVGDGGFQLLLGIPQFPDMLGKLFLHGLEPRPHLLKDAHSPFNIRARLSALQFFEVGGFMPASVRQKLTAEDVHLPDDFRRT